LARPRLKVEVPKPGADRPELGRVGIIAGVGFAIGVAWPWLAGVRLVPSPPKDDATEAAPSGSAALLAPSGDPAASAVPAASGSIPAPPVRTREETVKVSEMKITVCRDNEGKKLKDCDRVGFDALSRPHLEELAKCEGAIGASQTLSLGFELDFEKKAVTDVFAGKSTTFPKDKVHALVECAKKEFEGVRLDAVDHEHGRYTAFYFIEFVPPGTVSDAPGTAAEETAEASGLATIDWDVAVVRDQPEDGKILTRLRYGTRVVVTARRGKWYEVKYDAKGTKGWVHRNALGL
jgi:hypothetical protein